MWNISKWRLSRKREREKIAGVRRDTWGLDKTVIVLSIMPKEKGEVDKNELIQLLEKKTKNSKQQPPCP